MNSLATLLLQNDEAVSLCATKGRTMKSKALLYILKFLIIGTQANGGDDYDDYTNYSDPDWPTNRATPAPIANTNKIQSRQIEYPDYYVDYQDFNNKVTGNKVAGNPLLNYNKYGTIKPKESSKPIKLVDYAYLNGEPNQDYLRNALLVLMRRYMKDIEWKAGYLKKVSPTNPQLNVRFGNVINYVDKKYNDLTRLYNKIRQHEEELKPVKLLRIYDQIRKGNLFLSTILSLFKDKTVMKNQGVELLKSLTGAVDSHTYPGLGIAWSYYDDGFS